MRHTRNRYQHGSIRKVPRANGFAWEFRFYCSDEIGERKLKTQTFDTLKYPTETAVRKAVEPQLADLALIENGEDEFTAPRTVRRAWIKGRCQDELTELEIHND